VGIVAVVIVLRGIFLAVLPGIVRRVAMAQVPKLTGHVLLLDDVDLNLFTGHLALKGVKIQKAGTAAFKEELPGVTPPESGEAKLAALREALVKNEGSAAERLASGAAQAPSTEDLTEDRIEFQIEQ
jgi:hypothetical protein